MTKNMWVGVVCFSALFMLFLAGRGAAADINRDVDTSTRIGCGILDSAGSVHGYAESGAHENIREGDGMTEESASEPAPAAQYLLILGAAIGEIGKLSGVIRLLMT